MAEQLAYNRQTIGSIPTGTTMKKKLDKELKKLLPEGTKISWLTCIDCGCQFEATEFFIKKELKHRCRDCQHNWCEAIGDKYGWY